jgi:hypothetical protein
MTISRIYLFIFGTEGNNCGGTDSDLIQGTILVEGLKENHEEVHPIFILGFEPKTSATRKKWVLSTKPQRPMMMMMMMMTTTKY